MKLSGAEASRYIAKPDPTRPGLLIHGADAMRVALKRQEAILALIGPQGEADMRLSRIAGSDLRRDGALLLDAIKEVGFFPGPRAAFVEDATETVAPALTAALEDWKPGDATIVVTAGNLTPKSAVKTLFEKHPRAVAIGIYDDPPTREEIEAMLAKAGLTRIDPAAAAELAELARHIDPGDFRQTVEKLGLYKYGDATPLTLAEVAALAPATVEADVLDVASAAIDGRATEIGLLLRRLEGQGTQAVGICIQTLRYVRALHALAADPQGSFGRSKGFGPRGNAMPAQAQRWGLRPLEAALSLLVETDLTLRSTSKAPAMAVMERALIRLAMMKR